MLSAEIVMDAVLLLAVGLLLYIAWFDFWHLTIRNISVLILLGFYVVWAVLGGFQTLAGDLGAGLVLFLIGLVMWLAKMMGGGDVKLYFVLGLLMGFANIGLFAISLLAATLLFLAALIVSARLKHGGAILSRLREIHTSGRAPYAVPLCLAAAPVIVLRIIASV